MSIYFKIRKYIKFPVPIFFKKHLKKYRAVTLNSILIKAKAPKIIDFLSLDTEGAEFEVLNGIDFKRFSFRYMLIETYYFSKLKKFFLKKNYKYIKKINHNDYLFKFIK